MSKVSCERLHRALDDLEKLRLARNDLVHAPLKLLKTASNQVIGSFVNARGNDVPGQMAWQFSCEQLDELAENLKGIAERLNTVVANPRNGKPQNP